MKTFNEREIALLYYLKAAEPGRTVSGRELFRELFFRESEGRALIVQHEGRYAALFLSPALYDDETVRNAQIAAFLEAVRLIERLADEGYVTLYGRPGEKIVFVQDGFDSPSFSEGRIILNGRGDYTVSPQAVLDSSGRTLYKGIVLHDREYERIKGTVCASIIPGESLRRLVVPWSAVPSEMDGDSAGTLTADASAEPEESGPDMPQQRPGKETAVQRPDGKSGRRIASRLFSLLVFIAAALAVLWLHGRLLDAERQLLRLREVPGTAEEQSSGAGDAAVTAPADTLHYGIDVSHHNRGVLSLVDTADRLDFIICKATEGTGYVDPRFRDNWNLIASKGFIGGAYHFYRHGSDPRRQAAHYWNVVSAERAPEIAPILDVEADGFGGGAPPDGFQDGVLECLAALEAVSGRRPIVYTYYLFAEKYLTDGRLASYPLWLAEYREEGRPAVPHLWRDSETVMWQKKCDYMLHGMPVDLDVFFGNLGRLLD